MIQMSFIKLFCGRIARLFLSVIGIFKRALCFMRKRDNIGELPFTVKVDPNTAGHNRPPEFNGSSANPSDSWDNSWHEKAEVENKIEEYRRKKEQTQSVSEEETPNFFDDMEPEIKKTKKVILKPRVGSSVEHPKRNLFSFSEDTAVIPQVGEFGELEDLDDNAENAWDDNLDQTLQSHKQQHLEEKRRQRLEEHERRNREKVARSGMSQAHY